ncbi:MAG: alpha-glucosidase [Promethearchaeia archaeon]|nr:MAG: alpha-glucosidase [Candidatus Lokiarchaeia archaeon]
MRDFQDTPWWKKTTVYQIYPRSFYDSNGDGIGDLMGIISKLDYIKETGFETIWFSPFYDSPQRDFGYDIRDYRNVAPEYGTLKDAEELIEQIHVRDMKIVMDMILNHTSDEHPWFLESKKNRDNPKRDWYIWRDGKKPNGKAPPNNWISQIGGSGWHYDSKTDQWYWAAFLPFQPDLNFRNPEVQEEMLDTMRFWLDKGVDGFRLDILGSLFEDAEFRNNPFTFKLLPSESDPGMLFRSAEMTINHPDTIAFTKRLRALTDEYSPDRFMVGEVFGSYPTIREFCGTPDSPGIHSVFQFQTLETPFSYKGFTRLLKESEKWFSEPYVPTWAFSNHDRTRRISVLGNDIRKAKLNAFFQLTVRGVPYIYYGEEIGMKQVDIPFSNAQDGLISKFQKYPSWMLSLLQKLTTGAINRDGCRTPMQWSASENAGFTAPSVKPWLPVDQQYAEINVEKVRQDPDSIWHFYHRILKLREKRPVLAAGALEILKSDTLPKKILGYKRLKLFDSHSEEMYIFLNFSNKEVKFSNIFGNLNLLASTTIHSNPLKENKIFLSGWEGIITEKIK